MKKKRKNKPIKKRKKLCNLRKSKKILIKKRKKIKKKLKKNKKKVIIKKKKISLKQSKKKQNLDDFISLSVRIEEIFKSKFSFKFKINILAVDRFIAKFFQKIEEKIQQFKLLRFEEKRRLKLEAI